MRLNHYQNQRSWLVALLTCSIFALHPAVVEPVIYISSSADPLATMISLLSLLYLQAIGQQSGNRSGLADATLLVPFFILAFIGLFIKESSVVLYGVAFIYLCLIVMSSVVQRCLFIAGALMSIGAYLFIRLYLAHVPILTHYNTTISNASVFERVLTVPYIISHYLVTSFAPISLLIYQNRVIHSIGEPTFIISVSVLFTFMLLFIWLLRKTQWNRLALFSLAWFFLALTPVLNLYGIDMTVSDRWLYFPLIGLSLFVSTSLSFLVTRKPKQVIISVVLIFLFLGFCIFRSAIRIGNWQSGYVLYGHDLRYITASPELMNNYALELLNRQRYDEAEGYLNRSIQILDDFEYAHINLGNVYLYRREFDRAADKYWYVIERYNNPHAYANLAALYINQGRLEDSEKVLFVAENRFPTFKRLMFLRVLLLSRQGKTDEARTLLESLLSQNPTENEIDELNTILEKINVR